VYLQSVQFVRQWELNLELSEVKYFKNLLQRGSWELFCLSKLAKCNQLMPPCIINTCSGSQTHETSMYLSHVTCLGGGGLQGELPWGILWRPPRHTGQKQPRHMSSVKLKHVAGSFGHSCRYLWRKIYFFDISLTAKTRR
jgi:hypothetical protein